MSLLYTLGWPGMLNLPCVIVDQVTREVYNPEHKLPLSKIHLNTTNNKYVELAAILKLFPPGKDKDAMHSFMSISSEFGMRKFFMDRHQRAYISLDTLLVYLIVYPHCPEFITARAQIARYLQTFREIPCLICGFINRDCQCRERSTLDNTNYDIIGYASELLDRETQTDAPPDPPSPLPNAATLPTSTMSGGLPVGTATPHLNKGSMQSILNVNPPTSGIATVNPTTSKDKQTNKVTPINIVTPLRTRPILVDASCQTRANFDFSMNKRDKISWENKSKDIPGAVDQTKDNGKDSSNAPLNNGNKTPGSGNTPLVVHSQPISVGPVRQPVRVSLWKLLDSDSSSDEDDKDGNKKKKKTNSGNQDIDKFKAPLPKSLDFSNEKKESNTTEKLTDEEKALLQEAEKLAPADGSSKENTDNKDNNDDDNQVSKGKDKTSSLFADKDNNRTEEDSSIKDTPKVNESEEPMDQLQKNEDTSVEISMFQPLGIENKSKENKETRVKTLTLEKPDNNNEETLSGGFQGVTPEVKDIATLCQEAAAKVISEATISKLEARMTRKPLDTEANKTNEEEDDVQTSKESNVKEDISADKEESSETPTDLEDKIDQSVPPTDEASNESKDSDKPKEDKPEEKDSLVTEKDSSVTEEQDSSITEGKDSSETEEKDSLVTEEKDSLVREGKDSSVSEGKDSSVSEGKDSSVSEEKDSSVSEEKDSSVTEQKDSPVAEEKMDTEEATQIEAEGAMDKEPEKVSDETVKESTSEDKEKDTDGIKDPDDSEALVINEESEEKETETKSHSEEKETETKSKTESESKTDSSEAKESAESAKGENETEDGKDSKETDETKTKSGEDDSSKTDNKENKAKTKEKPLLNYKKWCHRFEYTPTGEKLYRCTFTRCGQCFDTKNSAAMHNRVHGTFGRESSFALQCYKCEYNTSLNKWFDMVRHLKFAHDERITQTDHSCFLCGREFPDHESVTRHIDFHYSGRYKCVHCGNILFTWKQVEEHIKDSCESKEKKDKNLGCPYCPLVFHIRNMRNAHMLSHQDKGLVCTFCDNEDLWENWKLLRKHYQQKHGDKIKNNINPLKKVSGQNKPALDPKKEPALKPSKVKIDIKKNPQCHVCDEEFTVMEDFEYHMRKKHDFVPYVLSVCEMCEKTFKTMKMYEWHMRNTHADDIKCDQCDFVAKTQLMLKVHIQNQHTSKEHACTECGKEFEHYHQLRMHMARHALHTIYSCAVCGEEFKRQKELRQHTNSAHPKNNDQPQQTCPDCEYSCFTRRAMDAHIKKCHPQLAEEIEESEHNPVLQPEHSYFNRGVMSPTTPTIPVPTIPTLKPPRPEKVREEGEGSLVIRLPKNISKKYKKGSKNRKRKYSSTRDDEPREVSEEVMEKRRVKREKRENMERFKILSRETCARTRTYDDFRTMRELFKHKELQQQASNVQADQEQEWNPDPKRPRVSKYGRSITTKALDDSFVPSVKFYNDQGVIKEHTPSEAAQYRIEKQKRADAIKKQRVSLGLYGVAPPETWEDEDVLIDYPYNDHSYFMIEHALTIPSQPPQPTAAQAAAALMDISQRRISTQYDEPPTMFTAPGGMRSGGLIQDNLGTSEFDDIAAQQDMQTIRIGPGGIMKKSKNRKQKIQYRTGIDLSPPGMSRGGSGFMPLMPENSNYGQPLNNQGAMDLQQEEIIEQDLIREVTEIAQKDPVLQDLINSMQQTAEQGGNVVPPSPQPNSASSILLNQGTASGYQNLSQGSGFPVIDSFQGNPGMMSRGVTPPRTLNIPSVTGSDMLNSNIPGSSSAVTPSKQLTAIASGSGTGLTPTKQNVLDLILGKASSSTELEDIDLNEDELKLLLNEHNRSIEQTQDGGGGDDSQDSITGGAGLIQTSGDDGQQIQPTNENNMGDMAQDILQGENEANQQNVIINDNSNLIEQQVQPDGITEGSNMAELQSGVIEEQSNIVEQQTDVIEEQPNIVEEEGTSVMMEDQISEVVTQEGEVVTQESSVNIEEGVLEQEIQQQDQEGIVMEQNSNMVEEVVAEEGTRYESLDNPNVTSVTLFTQPAEEEGQTVNNEQQFEQLTDNANVVTDVAGVPISVTTQEYVQDSSELSSSGGGQQMYQIVYQQPDGQTITQSMPEDGASLQADVQQQPQIVYQQTADQIPQMSPLQESQMSPQIPISLSQMSPEISHMSTEIPQMSPQISNQQILVSSVDNQQTSTFIQAQTPDGQIIYTNQQQPEGFENSQETSGISALIAASQVSEQEQSDAIANIMPDNQLNNSGSGGQIVHKQIQYVNEVGELISVQIAEPQGSDLVYRQSEQQDGQGVQLGEQLVTPDQVQNIVSSLPSGSSMTNLPSGSVKVLSSGEGGGTTTRRIIRTMGLSGSTPIAKHTIVKQVLQEPATVPMSGRQQQFRTVQISHKPRQVVNTSSAASSKVQYIHGNQPRSLLGNQPRQFGPPRQYISTRGRGGVNVRQYQQPQRPSHRVVRLSSPNQIMQNQNQTKIVKLPSAAASSGNQQFVRNSGNQSVVIGNNQGQSTGRIVSIGGSSSQGQRIVRVVQRPSQGSGFGRQTNTLVRPTVTQRRVITTGPRHHAQGVRIQATAAQSSAPVTMVRLESDGQGGQRMVQITEQQQHQMQ